MNVRSSASYFRTFGLAAALAASALSAQDAPRPRFGLGLSDYFGWVTANPTNFVGVEGFVRVAGGAFWSARVDGTYFGVATSQENIGCVTPAPAPACDTRQLGKLGTVMTTVVAGSRESNGVRHVYGLLGAGVAVTRWAGGYYNPGPNSHDTAQQGVGAGPTLAAFQAGFGSEFRALGGNRIELRMDYVRPSPSASRVLVGENRGRAFSLTLGRVW